MKQQWKKIKKSYGFLSVMANIFVAVSVTGLSILGVISTQMAFNTLMVSVVVLGVVGLVGRFILQDLEDDGHMFWDGEDKNDNCNTTKTKE